MTYAGVAADAQGAGLLGFATITQTNDRTFATDVKTFDLVTKIGDWFPFVGLPQVETFSVAIPSSSTIMSRQKAVIYKTIQSDPNNPLGSFSVVPQVIDSTETEQVIGSPPASPQRSTEEIYSYDDLANVTNYQINHVIEGSSENKAYAITNDTTKSTSRNL